MYGPGYPGEEMRAQFRKSDAEQFKALVHAADTLAGLHGTWKVPYGDLYRTQRVPNVGDLSDARFDDGDESLPCIGGHGPMGVAFTEYYSPSIVLPPLITQRNRYAMAGASYIATWEFGSAGVRGASLVPFGASGDPDSPHYLDQAPLMEKRQMKPELFTEQQVMRHAVRSYRPGAETGAATLNGAESNGTKSGESQSQ
jgi:acyl-homoserine lactone acylase PvdQ